MMTEDFLNLMEGVDKDDKEEQDCRMKDVYDEVELWEKDPAKSIPFATTRIKQAIRQFTGLVSGSLTFFLPPISSAVTGSSILRS